MAAIEWHDFANREALDTLLAASVAKTLAEAIATRGEASLVVSGGRTPAGLFAHLRQSTIDWGKVWVTLADERWVDADHADSNEALVRQHLLLDKAAKARFVGLKSGGNTPVEGLATSAAQLAAIPAPFDVVILGMGDDGHTASLFPQAPELAAAIDPAGMARLAAISPITAPHARITFTLPALASARRLILHMTGEAKRDLLLRQFSADAPETLPIRRVIDAAKENCHVYWAP